QNQFGPSSCNLLAAHPFFPIPSLFHMLLSLPFSNSNSFPFNPAHSNSKTTSTIQRSQNFLPSTRQSQQTTSERNTQQQTESNAKRHCMNTKNTQKAARNGERTLRISFSSSTSLSTVLSQQ
ncbi:hypothetical protein AABB24_039680, partial [Solanum stoloniferum]